MYVKNLVPPVKKAVPESTTSSSNNNTPPAPMIFNFNKQAETTPAPAPVVTSTAEGSEAEADLSTLSIQSTESNPSEVSPAGGLLEDSLDTVHPEEEEQEQEEEEEGSSGPVDLSKLNEYDVIHGLKVMYREKYHCEPTEEMVDQWLLTIRNPATNNTNNNTNTTADTTDNNNSNV